MKALGRRNFLRGAGVAAAAPVLVPVAAQARQSNLLQYALGGGSAAGYPVPNNGVLSVLRQTAIDAFNAAQRHREERLIFRLGPFDPDIAALSSMSYAARMNMQMKRDQESRSLIERLQKAAFGE